MLPRYQRPALRPGARARTLPRRGVRERIAGLPWGHAQCIGFGGSGVGQPVAAVLLTTERPFWIERFDAVCQQATTLGTSYCFISLGEDRGNPFDDAFAGFELSRIRLSQQRAWVPVDFLSVGRGVSLFASAITVGEVGARTVTGNVVVRFLEVPESAAVPHLVGGWLEG